MDVAHSGQVCRGNSQSCSALSSIFRRHSCNAASHALMIVLLQVDWITYRAFMTANWYAGKNADDAMWNDNRKGDDMFLVDGSMRVIDLIKAYRRRTLVERALKVHGQQWRGTRGGGGCRHWCACQHQVLLGAEG